MKILKIAAITAVFAAQFTMAQFKQTPFLMLIMLWKEILMPKRWKFIIQNTVQHMLLTLNKAIAGTPQEKETLFQILSNVSKLPAAVRNNAGGHYNHELFWTVLTPQKNTQPSAKLAKAITETFGSMDAFKEKMSKAGADRFGSGWAWLSVGERWETVCFLYS